MLSADIEKPLALLELQCETVAAAVVSGEALALEQASDQLRQAARNFSALMEQLAPEATSGRELRARLKKLSTQLGIQREQLLRRSAMVERYLQTLLPSSQKSTYAPVGRAGAYRGFAS